MPSTQFVPVSIREIRKSYGIFDALKNVSLDIKTGEFVSILGPSGSGKTTLLQMIGGFVRPTSGQIFFGDTDVTLFPPQRRDIGVVFQNYALFPHLTVAENIAFPLRARKVPSSECAAKVEKALATVELSGYGNRPIGKLSGGQRQRVALARAIVFEPRLILMDEPLSALDKNLRETMQIELRKLHDQLGATVIYVTHDQREALTMSDRVAVMNAGRIVQIDTPKNLYSAPADHFVAGFVGESTLVPVQRIGEHQVELGGHHLKTSRSLPAGELVVALQAEAILPCEPDEQDPSSNYISGVVEDVLFQGESLRTSVRLADNVKIALRIPSHRYNHIALPMPGSLIRMKLHIEDTIVVPRHSETT
ncbi:ABC transporter ATP-binding protein [Agrobacterium tumefaciens]|uniref:ABC transporter ATP-binding protein n=1 Tax=Agrobacterium tumefaciens TaxID=358 RepID=UPI0015740E1C|nr:ABC transporter ATP-binding protein [Agrobacterium tumefaciens]NSX89165.1 ABC transporter ATP-binding protein [Agrobacterium tumefaciens]